MAEKADRDDRDDRDETIPNLPQQSGSGTRPRIPGPVDTEGSTVAGVMQPLGENWDEWLGRELDQRYRIVELIGEGGMGAVFAAKHLKLSKDVAIKVIRPQFAGNGEIAARFAREAMATARFEHPNVASAIDYGTLPEGGAYFVMQLVRGERLSALLEREGAMHWSRASNIGAQLADALSTATANNIVHRDLKPDNIIIQRCEDGSDLVKILDFGIAGHARESSMPPPRTGGTTPQKLTREGTIVGTPGYMAPEQAIGDRVSHSADLYALGVVIWECIAGRQLWEYEDLSILIKRQFTEPLPSLRELYPEEDIPEELDRLLYRLVSVSPKDRPEQAGEVRDILHKLILESTVTGLPDRSVSRRDDIVPGQVSDASTTKEHQQQVQRKKDGPEITGDQKTTKGIYKHELTEPGLRFLVYTGLFAIFLAMLAGVMIWIGEDPVENVQALPEAMREAAKPAKRAIEPVRKAIEPVKTIIEIPDRTEREAETNEMPALEPAQRADIEIPDRTEREAETNEIPALEPAQRADEERADEGKADIAGTEMRAVPPRLERYVKPMMEGDDRKTRVEAANKILAYSSTAQVPEFLLAVARLQKAKTCPIKKEELGRITTLGDVRALPALLRLSRQRRGGCGPRKRNDCLSCLRQDLKESIQRFESQTIR